MKFVHGHNSRGRFGSDNSGWKGGKILNNGYVTICKSEHPRADKHGYVLEHILVAEKALGKPLPNGVEIHHINENRADNRKENLVVCENNAYHKLLHQRMRASKICGNPNWRKCTYCKMYDGVNNLFITKQNNFYHKKCKNKYERQRRARKRAEGRIS